MNKMRKAENHNELLVKFTKILAELTVQLKQRGFRISVAKSILKSASENTPSILESLDDDELEAMDIERVLNIAADKLSKDSNVMYSSYSGGFISNKDQLILKYRILSYLRDSMKKLVSNKWEGDSSEFVDSIIDETIKNKPSSPKFYKGKNNHEFMECQGFPDQEDALARGGMYLPKVIMAGRDELGFGIIQFNYDLESLTNNDENEDE